MRRGGGVEPVVMMAMGQTEGAANVDGGEEHERRKKKEKQRK
jgi:hypothetical protein